MRKLIEYRIFIASPSGLEDVRKAFHDEVLAYNTMDSVRRGVYYNPVGWEETLGGPRRPQELINADLVECDAFLLVLWDHWGSPPSVDGPYTSGCEEEFQLAVSCLNGEEFPTEELLVFFKAVEPKRLVDPGPQLNRVLEFKKALEASKEHLFMTFDEVSEWRSRVRSFLARWVYQIESGTRMPREEPPRSSFVSVVAPESTPAAPGRPDLDEAETLAKKGLLTDAEAIFARAISTGSDREAFNQYGLFLRRLGRLSQAEVMFSRLVELSPGTTTDEWKARAQGNIGVLRHVRGDYEGAERKYLQALASFRELENLSGMAKSYNNLGVLYHAQGDLEKAEDIQLKALAIAESSENSHGEAAARADLANIFLAKGEIANASRMLDKAQAIFEELGDDEGLADTFLGIGRSLIFQARYDEAEAKIQEARRLFERVGFIEGIADALVKLAQVSQKRGQLDSAEDRYARSRELYERLGSLGGKAAVFGGMGIVWRLRGEFEKAEKLHRRALAINGELHDRANLAKTYRDLGVLYREKGALIEAEEMLRRALGVYDGLQQTLGRAKVCEELGVLYLRRGEFESARPLLERAMEFSRRMDLTQDILRVEPLYRESLAAENTPNPPAPGESR